MGGEKIPKCTTRGTAVDQGEERVQHRCHLTTECRTNQCS